MILDAKISLKLFANRPKVSELFVVCRVSQIKRSNLKKKLLLKKQKIL